MTEADNRICPACPDGTGIPKSVKVINWTTELTLACNACEHVWTISWPDKSMSPFTTMPSPDEVASR